MLRWPRAISVAIALANCQAPEVESGQADPGSAGNGIVEQAGPYLVPEEARHLIDGAPEGVVSPAALYESSVYQGLRFQYWVYVPAHASTS